MRRLTDKVAELEERGPRPALVDPSPAEIDEADEIAPLTVSKR